MVRYESLLKISVRYFDYMKHPGIRLGFASFTKGPLSTALKYVKNVKRTLNELNKDERDLINREFFSTRDNPEWWKKYYSKSTYYRKRYFAIKNFMERYGV